MRKQLINPPQIYGIQAKADSVYDGLVSQAEKSGAFIVQANLYN